MRNAILLLMIGALAFYSAAAQTKKSEQVKAWKQFQTAVARNDKTKVAAMIEFPFEGSLIGSEMNHRVESETDFIKNYSSIFTAARRAKIGRGKIVPLPDEDEFHFEMPETGGHHVFTFRKIGSAYILVGTMAAG